MFDVRLLNEERIRHKERHKSDAYQMAQIAASNCYQPDLVSVLKHAGKIDVKRSLFDTGHHTTLQHADHYLSYRIDNVPVSLVTFGLHMMHPFYNSSQKSGRYSVDMFRDKKSLLDYICKFIDTYCRHVSDDIENFKSNVISWVTSGHTIFNNHLEEVVDLARDALRVERPHYDSKGLERQARRIAQEQLRVFISTIVPTSLIHTINVSSLYALDRVAWNKPFGDLVDAMIDNINDSDVDFGVSPNTRRHWAPVRESFDVCVTKDINVKLLSKSDYAASILTAYFDDYVTPSSIDTFFFDPRCDPMSIVHDHTVKVRVTVPVLTYGQDQRHRTIQRSVPELTGSFYVPPLLRQLPHIDELCERYMETYLNLCTAYGSDTMLYFIPYGAMVTYTKQADVRAYAHCVLKRLCWNADSMIAEMERKTLTQLYGSEEYPIGPRCVVDRCREGSRWCGRDIRNRISRRLI